MSMNPGYSVSVLQKHRCNDPQREKKKERELGLLLLLLLLCNVTGARRFVHWDGLRVQNLICQIMQSVFWIYMVGVCVSTHTHTHTHTHIYIYIYDIYLLYDFKNAGLGCHDMHITQQYN
jgi:hypothetical protein